MKRIYGGRGMAALMTALLAGAGILAGAMVSFGAVYVSDEPYDWEENADGRGYDSPRYIDSGTGPGASEDSGEEQDMAAGPTVTQVTLAEQYHDDYKVYEESINNLFFFYTNVSNGGITDENVILDVPQNMFCTVEKDGADYDYIPGQAFSEYGTYVVRVTAVEDTSVPFSQQKEYRALFRFRIQEKPPQTEEGETDGQGLFSGSPGGSGTGASSLWQESGIWPDGSNVGTEDGLSEVGTESQEAVQGDLEGTGSDRELPDGEGEEAIAETSQETEDRDNETDSDLEKVPDEGIDPGTGGLGTYSARTQVYDSSRGRYIVTFENGRTMVTNVPEGYMGPGTVELFVSEGEGSLYCNDESLEYVENMSLKDPGYYRLDVDGQTWSFAIASAVGSTDYYLAPEGFTFTGIYCEGEPKDVPMGRYLYMREDGQYEISMTGTEGEKLDVVLKKDTQSPQFVVDVRGGKAQIQYVSDDIAGVILEKNGEVLEGFSGYTIDSPGSYRLTAKDAAGNASSAEFTLKYQVNTYGIVAVVLVILLIVGGAVFVVHVKKTVRVR